MDGGVYDDIHQRVAFLFVPSSSEKKKNKQTRTITIYVIGPPARHTHAMTHRCNPANPYANDPSQVDFVRRSCVCCVSR